MKYAHSVELGPSVFGSERKNVRHGVNGPLVVVLGNKGYGLQPLVVRSPHQIYETDIDKWEAEGFKEISIAKVTERKVVAFVDERQWRPKGKHER